MDEFALIRRYFARECKDDSVRIGIGDDGAVLVPEKDRELVTVVDTLVEDVHFPANLPPADIGYRSLAVNLSDIAAMGARPRWMTLALTLDEADDNWLEGFASGLFTAADAHDVNLVGGDTTRGSSTVISIQLTGDCVPGTAISRAGASPGDKLYVSGTIGDAAAGLSLIKANDVATGDRQFLANRFSRPTARVALGQVLAGVASAAIDISDGLYADAVKLLAMSNVGATIATESIPLSSALTAVFSDADALQFALTGGDDYELCFAVQPENEQTVIMRAEQCGVAVSLIGEVLEGNGLRCTRADQAFEFDHGGYRHF